MAGGQRSRAWPRAGFQQARLRPRPQGAAGRRRARRLWRRQRGLHSDLGPHARPSVAARTDGQGRDRADRRLVLLLPHSEGATPARAGLQPGADARLARSARGSREGWCEADFRPRFRILEERAAGADAVILNPVLPVQMGTIYLTTDKARPDSGRATFLRFERQPHGSWSLSFAA